MPAQDWTQIVSAGAAMGALVVAILALLQSRRSSSDAERSLAAAERAASAAEMSAAAAHSTAIGVRENTTELRRANVLRDEQAASTRAAAEASTLRARLDHDASDFSEPVHLITNVGSRTLRQVRLHEPPSGVSVPEPGAFDLAPTGSLHVSMPASEPQPSFLIFTWEGLARPVEVALPHVG